MAEPHSQNVPGPFYVENGCCITCGVPEDIAPDMFGWAEGDPHCFVKRQPCDAKQLGRLLQAMWSSEVDCIRYRGTDLAIARRIAEFGNEDSCDFPPPRTRFKIRDQVRFRSSRPRDTPLSIAARFRASLAAAEGPLGPRYLVRKPRWWNRQTVIFSWEPSMRRFRTLNRVLFSDEGDGWLRAYVRRGLFGITQGLALQVHEWLEETEGALEICWLTREERERGLPGLASPI